MKKIILFDMDGTLTPHRNIMERGMAESLVETFFDPFGAYRGFEIGIVTGSDYDYLIQQCKPLFDYTNGRYITLFPCNGTKKYEYEETKYWERSSNHGPFYKKSYEVDMIESIGRKEYNRLLTKIADFQVEIMRKYSDLPFTGTFLQYRNSMLNWSPIGRSASGVERQEWIFRDRAEMIREWYLLCLNKYFPDIEIAFGGQTSFDIYPKGWNKTYVMKHLEDYTDIYFIGDRCEEGGNDKALYDLLGNKGFNTTGPKQTIDIINKILGIS